MFLIYTGALKFPLQTSRSCRKDWCDNILNWNPCPETHRFCAPAIWKQALPERTSRVSTSNSFAIRPSAELHEEGCLGRIMWCQLTFILPAGSSLIHVSFSVRAKWLSTFLLITPTWSFCMAKLEVMEELLVAFIKIIFHNAQLHRIPFSPQRLQERGTFTTSRNNCGVPRRCRTPELEEAVGTMYATQLLVATSNCTCSGSECYPSFQKIKKSF